MSLGTELPSVVFGQHDHPTLIPCDVSLLGLSQGQSLQELPPNGIRLKRKYS
jgi:hypothetical protein